MDVIDRYSVIPGLQQLIGGLEIAAGLMSIPYDFTVFIFRGISVACSKEEERDECRLGFVKACNRLERDTEFVLEGAFRCIPVVASIYFFTKQKQTEETRDALPACDVGTRTYKRFENENISSLVDWLSAIPVIQQIVGAIFFSYGLLKTIFYDIPVITVLAFDAEKKYRLYQARDKLLEVECRDEDEDEEYQALRTVSEEADRDLLLMEIELKEDVKNLCEDLFRCVPVIATIYYSIMLDGERPD